MQSNQLPYDTTFVQRFQWSEPERDLQIVMQVVEGHRQDSPCPAQCEENAHLLRLLASNPNTPAQVLEHMVKCVTAESILERVANNPNASAEILRILAQHCSNEVRSAVAENSNADVDTIWMLARDIHTDVRFRLAENHDLSVEILEILCGDDNPYVAHRAEITKSRLGKPQQNSGKMQSFPDHSGPGKSNSAIRRAV